MNDISIEKLILSALVQNSEFTTHAISFLKPDYFHNRIEKVLFEQIKSYIREYSSLPKKSTLLIDIKNEQSLNELESNEAVNIISEVFGYESNQDYKWLIQKAEEFCRNKAVYNGIMTAISIYDGTDTKTNPGIIPEILKDAVSISFDTHVGLDFLDDAEARFNFYTQPDSKIKFNIEVLNDITNGGVSRRTLCLISAGINCGKSMTLCSFAADYLKNGYNVLYISLEMRSELIAQRIDANLLDVPINDIAKLDKQVFLNKVTQLKNLTNGKLKIKEYAPSSISALHIRTLLSELELKQKFKPDVILIDYLALLLSDRMPANTNSHFYQKAVSEEIRAIAVEYDCVTFSANQMSREGQKTTDASITDIGESIGIGNTADLMLLISRTDELDEIGQLHCKQLKNRFGNKSNSTRFTLGVDLEKQRLFDSPDYKQNSYNKNSSKQEEVVIQKSSTDTKSKFSGIRV